ncbi:MAG: adenylate/guanylate cyclase domain-containing protein [Candidatus Kariarchaeaceae archaeon]
MSSYLTDRNIQRLVNLGVEVSDSQDIVLKKQLVNIFGSSTTIAGFLWGILYFVNGEPLVALLPWIYVVASLILAFRYVTDHSRYNEAFLGFRVMIFGITFILSLALGDIQQASYVLIWAFSAPLITLITENRTVARRWFIAFVISTVVVTLIPPLRSSNNFSDDFIRVFTAANIIGMSLATYLTLEYTNSQRRSFMSLLAEEKERTEELLLNVLPKEVIPSLQEEDVYVQEFEDVSVMFADIVGFTGLTETMEPREMIDTLNDVFSFFDSLLQEHHAEKIRTVGDNYMVAVGSPVPVEDHAFHLVRMAEKMLDYLQREEIRDKGISFRIGINSGPVVAGVIGKHKFHFDIWGDMVNTASRFESHGIPGKIQIGKTTHELIKDRIACEQRGEIEIKGKGKVETWIVS